MMLSFSLLQLYSPVVERSPAPGRSMGLSKTRCEYFPVRSAPPSMAPHGFGKPHGPAFKRTRVSRVRLKRIFEGLSLWFAVLLMLFVHPLYAEANEADNVGQLHFFDGQGQWQEPALVLDSEFDIQVSGLIADTRLLRSFRNTSDQWREGVFVFPLPEKASVYGLTMKVGERTIEGKIQPRETARQKYEKAKQAGKHAANVEQQRPNLFTARVANIPPGETVSVELKYQQPVRYQAGVFELSIPTTLTPRYMPGAPLQSSSGQWHSGWAVPTKQVADADAISPFTVTARDVARDSHRASIDLLIDAGLPLEAVSSPSHQLATSRDGQAVTVRPAEGSILMNRDFVVRWRPLASREPSAALFRQIREQLGDQRLFTVAIGAAPNRYFMREAARWGRGTYTAIQSPAGSASGMLRYPQTATAAPLLIALGLVGLMFSVALVLLQRRVFP